MNGRQRPGLERTLGWAVLLGLAAGCFVVLRPFISALLWAVVLSFSCWPLYARLRRLLGGRHTLAAFLMTFAMVLIVLVPFFIVGNTLAENVTTLTGTVRNWFTGGPPPPPGWLEKAPLIGPRAAEYWQSLANDTAKLWTEARPLVEQASAWMLRAGVALGSGLAELALSIFVTFFLFRHGAVVGERLTGAVQRIGGARGQHLLEVASRTIRGVVYGILGTALLQALMAGIGYLIAGVPGAALLALLTFFTSVVPIVGTALVWVPAAIWLFHQGSTGWGIFMLIWGLGVANIDNVIKPVIISQGSNMPFLLIFLGVLGGAIAFGFIGVFLGPTLLAVGFRLVAEWSAVPPPEAEDIEPPLEA